METLITESLSSISRDALDPDRCAVGRRVADHGESSDALAALELSPGQWMYESLTGIKPKRIDLAVMGRDTLAATRLPTSVGSLPLDAVFEFALASSFWQHGIGSPKPVVRKVAEDVEKVAEYLRSGLATRGYVVVVEECDHGLPAGLANEAQRGQGVEVLLLQQWPA